MTWECKFIDRKTGETHYRNYKYKQLYEIEEIARSKGWLLVRYKKW